MGFYRFGDPGEDTVAHLNFGSKRGPQKCVMAKFPKDNEQFGQICGRTSVALCDSPGCDKPICELHRIKHPSKTNTDFCLDHVDLATSSQVQP